MLKLRITLVDNEKGQEQLEDFLELLKDNKMFECISKSRLYKGRGESKYSNIYLDIDYK